MPRPKDYLPIKVRKELGEYAVRCLIRKNPELTATQIKRIFCYSYFTLSKEDFISIYYQQKRVVKHEKD